MLDGVTWDIIPDNMLEVGERETNVCSLFME